MSEITAREFYGEMQKVRDLIDEKHKSIRSTLENRFDELNVKLDKHEADDRAVENRVLTIEIERKKEEQASIKRGGIAGIFAGGLVASVVELVKHLLK